jgi:hypothetical protein
MFDDDSPWAAPKHDVRCPHCTAQLTIGQDSGEPGPDDQATCYFHGVIGTRRDILHALNNGDLQMFGDQAVWR